MIVCRSVFAVCAAWLLFHATSVDAHENAPPLRVYGNVTTIEFAPVLLASDRIYRGQTTISNGGVPNLFVAGEADIATNAETQALRTSVDNPSLRIVMTVSEGLYRIVARRTAGIEKLEDLRGKRIATIPNTSSGYFLHRMLATVGMTEEDVTVVPLFPLDRMPQALQRGEVDAVTIWEPEMENAVAALGEDAIEFSGRGVYRELFNLNTTAEALADPERRCAVVSYVRALISASERICKEPREVWPLVAKSSGYDAALVEKVWHHHTYPGELAPDLLDVLVQEEVYIAQERNRVPRSRAELASLIDTSVIEEARASDAQRCERLLNEAARKRDAALAALQPRVDQLAAKVEALEAIRDVKRLQHAYAQYFEAGRWDDIAALFSRDGAVLERGHTVVRGDALQTHWRQQYGAGALGSTAGRLHSALFLSPVVSMDPQGGVVRARWHDVVMSGEYGKNAQWRGGIYENEYVKEDGVWKIHKENYYPQFAGPYESGWRNVLRETGKPEPVPYHYDPDRAGTPIPAQSTQATKPRSNSFEQLAAQVGELRYRVRQANEASLVQNLQHAYGFYFDRKMWDDVADLFAMNGTLEIGQQGVYVGRNSIRRGLEQFGPQGLRDNEINEHLQLQTVVTVAPDGLRATARGTQLRMTGVNQQGAQWGLDVFENTYTKQGGVWRIASMRIYPRMTTDYYQGWGKHAEPGLPAHPDFPADRPSTGSYAAYPQAAALPFHFAHPARTRDDVTAASVALRPRTLAELQAALDATEQYLLVAEAYDGAENVSNAYGYYIDEFLWVETGELFATDGWKELSYIGTYVGRDRVRDSMIKRYGLNGRRANGLAIHQKTQPVITVARDGTSARIRTRLFQINSSLENEGSYISGIYENEIKRENGVWKISGMDLDYVWTTSYSTGWAKVKTENDSRRFAPQPAFVNEYPPDRPLRGVTFAPFPRIEPTGFHYRNPVSGRSPPLLLP